MSSLLEGGRREPDPSAEQHDAEEGKLILTGSTKAWDLLNAVHYRFLAQVFGCIKLTMPVNEEQDLFGATLLTCLAECNSDAASAFPVC